MIAQDQKSATTPRWVLWAISCLALPVIGLLAFALLTGRVHFKLF